MVKGSDLEPCDTNKVQINALLHCWTLAVSACVIGRYIGTPSGGHVHLHLDLPPDHPTLEPRHFIDERVVNEHHQDYMFLECIKFINEVEDQTQLIHSHAQLFCVTLNTHLASN